MPDRLIRRRAHSRILPSGHTAFVKACFVALRAAESGERKSYRRLCPRCGAEIASIRMPNGGLVNFEMATGLSRVKHPCLHVGEGLSRRRDDQTMDLFEEGPADPSNGSRFP